MPDLQHQGGVQKIQPFEDISPNQRLLRREPDLKLWEYIPSNQAVARNTRVKSDTTKDKVKETLNGCSARENVEIRYDSS